MKAKPAKPAKALKPAAADDVDAFMAALEHPLKAEIEAVRRTILGVSLTISEGVKWNAPSFRTTEFFATVHLRSRDQVQLILHLGAKVRKDLPPVEIADPAGLLQWLGKDRASVRLGAGPAFAKDCAALAQVVAQWIAYV